MRIERWWWLGGFCILSLIIHLVVGLTHRSFAMPHFARAGEIEVQLEPLPPKSDPARKKKPEKPKPKPKPKAKAQLKQTRTDSPDPRPTPKRVRPPRERRPARRPAPPRIVKTTEPRPTAPRAEPGGVDPAKEERPLPLGLRTARRDTSPPRITRMARSTALPGGGGSPAPGQVPGGRGGAPGPEKPPEDIIFNGGGAGGTRLPKEAPAIGGGGGRSILSVENPLAKDPIPEDRPGLGPGLGGGQGVGDGRGVGLGRGAGIGTRPDGKQALATLRSKPGPGVGAGKGRGIGTNPPGGGRGTGSELPGTGGTGLGYGRGSGVGIGEGRGSGIGDGSGGGRFALSRGIPFGDITGVLRGNPSGGGGAGGGPGGPGRGGVFAPRPGSGGGGRARIVYVIDVSLSMREGNKIARAQEALKKALSELKPTDTFDIIDFAGDLRGFSETMVDATQENVQAALEYVDSLRLRAGTFVSGALQVALSLEKITHVFLLSDGEPTVGIRDPEQLRAAVQAWNGQHASILTLALGLGDQFPGIPLLKALAEENNGRFNYIDLSK